MALQPEPKIFLQNKLVKSQMELDDVEPRVESMRREVSKLEELREAYTANPALGDLDTVVENMFEAIRERIGLETQQQTLSAEVALLQNTLGDDANNIGKAHDYKASAFPVAKACYVCGGKIWGMSKVGLNCRVSLSTRIQYFVPVFKPG